MGMTKFLVVEGYSVDLSHGDEILDENWCQATKE